MLQLDYNPTGDENAPVFACLVGKGITFDSGGYSLKPSNMMSAMKADMGGSGMITGALGFGYHARLQQARETHSMLRGKHGFRPCVEAW